MRKFVFLGCWFEWLADGRAWARAGAPRGAGQRAWAQGSAQGLRAQERRGAQRAARMRIVPRGCYAWRCGAPSQ